jgi:hypothetical protein
MVGLSVLSLVFLTAFLAAERRAKAVRAPTRHV